MKRLLFAAVVITVIAAMTSLSSCTKAGSVVDPPKPEQDLLFSVDFVNMSQIATSTPWVSVKKD